VQRAIRERTLREETALLNRELVATRELLSQTTAQVERVRIARNLHDLLGHHMTALIRREGEIGKLLSLVLNYERRNWSEVTDCGISAEDFSSAYLESMAWATEIM
jgi:signal transduction histidine kinase